MNTTTLSGAAVALLPCPFCGNASPHFERTGTSRQSCIVECGNCGCRHESSNEGSDSGRTWNERAAHPAAVVEPVVWGNPGTVGMFVRQLQTIDPATPLYAAIHTEYRGKKVAMTKPVTISRERVSGRFIRQGDETVPYSIVVWAQQDQLAQPPEFPPMPEGWHVTVGLFGDTRISISDNGYGGAVLTDADDDLIAGAARHLLSFIGYGLPPVQFDSDAPPTPDDPMDWPLPCDVTVGHGTMRKGVALRTLVLRMKTLYEMATGNDADVVAERTPGERQALATKFLAATAPALAFDAWCCEKGEAAGRRVCTECAETSLAYSAAMGPGTDDTPLETSEADAR